MAEKPDTIARPTHRWLTIGAIVMTLIGVAVVEPAALLALAFDGLVAVLVLLPPALAGLWLVPLFRLGPLPMRWHLLIGATLGIGATSLTVLGLGLAGVLGRAVWIVVLSACAVVGVVRFRDLRIECSERNHGPAKGASSGGAKTDSAGALHHLWLLACPFLVLALLAALTVPGLSWSEEAFGYDVLEYHLQLPREYYETGRIEYTPHNVYGSFPANCEMLYLLGMIILEETTDACVAANMIHLALAMLAVFAAWVAGREWSPGAGTVCGVCMATAGWLAYLSGLAYVENGMLFFGTAAMAALVRAIRLRDRNAQDVATSAPQGPAAWLVLSGLAAGFACGCKYTGLPMIAVPLCVCALLLRAPKMRLRLVHAGLLIAGTAVSFGPWLAKNATMTGNPVFPLGNTVFKASPPGWGESETDRWDRGHALPAEARGLGDRLSALWHRIPADPYQRVGLSVFWLSAVGLFARRRDRVDLALAILLAFQLVVWMFFTHLFARFAVVMLIPLCLLAGRSLPVDAGRLRRMLVAAALGAGALWNFAFSARVWANEWPGVVPSSVICSGHPDLPEYEYLATINRLPEDAYVLVIGDAKAFYYKRRIDYCVVFNANPFAEGVQSARDDARIMAYLRERGYTHVLVHWTEVARLARTYGFAPQITPGLFDRLGAAGLTRLRDFAHPSAGARPTPHSGGGLYVTLFEVSEE